MQFGPLDHDCQTYTSAVTLRITLPYNEGIAMRTRKQREKQENLVGEAHGARIGAGASVLPAAEQLSTSTGRCSGEPRCTCSWHAAHRVMLMCELRYSSHLHNTAPYSPGERHCPYPLQSVGTL